MKKDIFNVNITIKAIPCDGIEECVGGIDEAYCAINEIYTIVAVMIGYLLIITMSFLLWRKEELGDNTSEAVIELNQTLFETEHASEALAAEIAYLHENTINDDERREISAKLLKYEVNYHNSTSQAICCLKVCFAR